MKKYISPEFKSEILSDEDIMIPSDVFVDSNPLFPGLMDDGSDAAV